MIMEFLDIEGISAHDRFQAWRAAHQEGVFLALSSRTRGRLHGVRCQHLGSGPPYFSSEDGLGSLTTKAKVCATMPKLLAWAAKNSVTVTRCQHCERDGLLRVRRLYSPSSTRETETSDSLVTEVTTEPDDVTTAVFLRALQLALPRMNDTQLIMLRAHYLAPEYVITTDELARAAGFDDHRAVNSQYGHLGSLLRQNAPELRDLNGQQSYALATFTPPDDRHPSWRWQLRGPLVDALSNLGWFVDASDSVSGADLRSAAANEGALRRRETWHRHREQSLRLAKIEHVMRSHPNARLLCQVPGCGFDFEARYGPIGRGYAEVHHLIPLSTLDPDSITTLDQLAVVCSNCHRMIHRGGECRPLAGLIIESTDSLEPKNA